MTRHGLIMTECYQIQITEKTNQFSEWSVEYVYVK